MASIMFMNLRRKSLPSATSITGMLEYLSREEAIDKGNLEESELSRMINYYGRESANEKVDGGFYDGVNKTNEMAKSELEYYRPKSVYQAVISFKPDDALNLGFEKKSDFSLLADKFVGDACKIKGIDRKNLVWTGYLHTNTENPHMHMYFFDKTKRCVDAELFSRKELTRLRSKLANNILSQVDKFELKDILLKDEIRSATELMDEKKFELLMKRGIIARTLNAFRSPEEMKIVDALIQCAKTLPEKGRCTYNVLNKYNNYAFQNVDKLVDLLVENSSGYQEYVKTAYEIEDVYKTLYGEDSKAKNYAFNQIYNLRGKIGNVAINQLKQSGAIQLYHQEKISKLDIKYGMGTMGFMCKRFNYSLNNNINMMMQQMLSDAKRSSVDEKKERSDI